MKSTDMSSNTQLACLLICVGERESGKKEKETRSERESTASIIIIMNMY